MLRRSARIAATASAASASSAPPVVTAPTPPKPSKAKPKKATITKPPPVIHILLSDEESKAMLITKGIREVHNFREEELDEEMEYRDPDMEEYKYFKLSARVLQALIKHKIITHCDLSILTYELETPEGEFIEESPDPSELVNARLYTSDGAYHDIRVDPFTSRIVLISYYKTDDHDKAIQNAKEFAIRLMEMIQRIATAPARSKYRNLASLHKTLRGNSARSSAMHRVFNAPGLGEYAMSFLPKTTRHNHRSTLRMDPNVSAAKHAFTRVTAIVERFAHNLMAQAPEIEVDFRSSNYIFNNLKRG